MTGDQPFADSRVFAMFPTCVWLHDLKPEDYQPINQRILPIIKDLLARQGELEANRTWQTHHDLHHREEFQDLIGFARTATRNVLDFLLVDYADFQITGCWANLNPPRSEHRPHIHPNNYLSGVYYAQVPDKTDGLVFHEPRAQALVMQPKVKKVTDPTNSEYKIDVRQGRLFVFPSWLRHSVQKTSASGERVSVSFNIMLSSFAEEFSPPRWSKPR